MLYLNNSQNYGDSENKVNNKKHTKSSNRPKAYPYKFHVNKCSKYSILNSQWISYAALMFVFLCKVHVKILFNSFTSCIVVHMKLIWKHSKVIEIQNIKLICNSHEIHVYVVWIFSGWPL